MASKCFHILLLQHDLSEEHGCCEFIARTTRGPRRRSRGGCHRRHRHRHRRGRLPPLPPLLVRLPLLRTALKVSHGLVVSTLKVRSGWAACTTVRTCWPRTQAMSSAGAVLDTGNITRSLTRRLLPHRGFDQHQHDMGQPLKGERCAVRQHDARQNASAPARTAHSALESFVASQKRTTDLAKANPMMSPRR